MDRNNSLLLLILFSLLPLFSYVAGLNLLYPTPDSIEYRGFYDFLDEDKIFDFEIGFYLISYFFKFILRFSYYQFIVSFLFIGLVSKFLVFIKFRNYILVYLSYFICNYYFSEAIVVRASVAQGIAMLGYLYFAKSRFKSYALVFFASSIHYSTGLFILSMYLFNFFEKYLSVKTLIIFVVLLSLLASVIIEILLFIPRFGPYYYSNPDYFNIWGIPLISISLISIIHLLGKVKKFNLVSKLFLYQSMILSLLSLVFYRFSLFSIRLLDLAHIMLIILLFQLINRNVSIRTILILLFYLSYLFFTRVFDGSQYILGILK